MMYDDVLIAVSINTRTNVTEKRATASRQLHIASLSNITYTLVLTLVHGTLSSRTIKTFV